MRWRVGFVGVLLVLGACTGGGTFVSSVGGSSGASGGVGGSTGMSPPSPPPGSDPGEPVEIPFVACSLDAPMDGGSDADGTDAGGPDAGSSDADSPPTLDDAGPGDSHCFTPPPPECVGQTSMVHFSAQGCDGQRCIYIPEVIDCPGGCFRQVDGGERCNQ